MREQEATVCYIYEDMSVYNLMPLRETSLTLTAANSTYHINFCKFEPGCGQNRTLAFERSNTDPKQCVDYTGTKSWQVDTRKEKENLVMEYSGNQVCKNAKHEEEYHTLEMTMVCDREMEDGKIEARGDVDTSDEDSCTQKVTLASRNACPKLSATPFVEFLAEHPWAMGILLIVSGGIIAFFGRKFIQHAVAVISGGAAFLIVMLIFSWLSLLEGLTKPNGSLVLAIVMTIIAIAIGVLVGHLFFKMFTLGATIVAAIAGAFFGITFYQMFFLSSFDSIWLLWFFTIVFGALGGYLSFLFFDYIIMGSTALLGAYGVVRGISMYFGHFPNEIMLFERVDDDVEIKFDSWFYGYVLGLVVLFIAGGYFQYRAFRI